MYAYLLAILSAKGHLVFSLFNGCQTKYYAKRPDTGSDREHIPDH